MSFTSNNIGKYNKTFKNTTSPILGKFRVKYNFRGA
jgi:hypothetical protein